MRRLKSHGFRTLGWVAAMAVCSPVLAGAAVSVDEAWVRAMPPGQSVTALYFTATNHSAQVCALTLVRTAAARRTELHRTTEEDGMARMRLQDVIDVPARTQAKLAPGGDHVMLFDVVSHLESGDVIIAELDFGACGEVTVEAEVRAPTSARAEPHHH